MSNLGVFRQKSISLDALESALSVEGHAVVSKTERKLLNEMPVHLPVYIALNQTNKGKCAKLLPYAKSQNGQDILAAALCPSREGGYFVEFGGCNGEILSNTNPLEKRLHWSRIVAEPAKCWHDELNEKRDCSVDHRCVYSKTGLKLPFLEVNNKSEKRGSPELSGLRSHSQSDWASEIRHNSNSEYSVETVSLNDLLDDHQDPENIDNISIDTEGSERKILETFDFQKRNIHLLSVGHNYNSTQCAKIQALMESNKYTQILPELSLWDD